MLCWDWDWRWSAIVDHNVVLFLSFIYVLFSDTNECRRRSLSYYFIQCPLVSECLKGHHIQHSDRDCPSPLPLIVLGFIQSQKSVVSWVYFMRWWYLSDSAISWGRLQLSFPDLKSKSLISSSNIRRSFITISRIVSSFFVKYNSVHYEKRNRPNCWSSNIFTSSA